MLVHFGIIVCLLRVDGLLTLLWVVCFDMLQALSRCQKKLKLMIYVTLESTNVGLWWWRIEYGSVGAVVALSLHSK